MHCRSRVVPGGGHVSLAAVPLPYRVLERAMPATQSCKYSPVSVFIGSFTCTIYEDLLQGHPINVIRHCLALPIGAPTWSHQIHMIITA
jgi:hypothetical protein